MSWLSATMLHGVHKGRQETADKGPPHSARRSVGLVAAPSPNQPLGAGALHMGWCDVMGRAGRAATRARQPACSWLVGCGFGCGARSISQSLILGERGGSGQGSMDVVACMAAAGAPSQMGRWGCRHPLGMVDPKERARSVARIVAHSNGHSVDK